jgi:GNAT superfamily N-acetyltransferase
MHHGRYSSRYSIREVSGKAFARELRGLHEATFGDDAPLAPTCYGHWWLAYLGGEPVGFAGLVPAATLDKGTGYLKRAGVLEGHRGQGLQLRLIRVREQRARRNGWHTLVTETTDNPASANNLIKAGFRIFEPETRWAFQHSIYWRKKLTAGY